MVMKNLSRKSLTEQYRRGRRDFRGIHLRGVTLGESLVRGGNYEALKFQSCDFSDAVIDKCSCVGSDLSGSKFVHTDLSGSNFARAILTDCNFYHASLIWCNLNVTNFSGSKLTYADFSATTIWRANFSQTLLTGAQFYSANLISVLLTGARAAYLSLGDTSLINMDLATFANARITKHWPDVDYHSNIDWRSIARSLHLPSEKLKQFLVAIGMPASLADLSIEAVKSLDPTDISTMMQSTFISYGQPDEKFAIALRNELQRNGVTTFLFCDNAVPGQKLHRMMREGVNEYDRVILICSEASLDRVGVLNEIEETLQREARDGGEAYLIPIRLDDYVFDGWNPKNNDAAQAVRDRVIGDFRAANKNTKVLPSAIGPLLLALKKKKEKINLKYGLLTK